MNGKALGIIETVGLVPAIEAGDVAVKTADVTIIGSQAVGGGLVSILMKGDVAAVKASVDAGASAADRLGEVVSVTVIARTAEGLGGILIEEGKRPTCVPEPCKGKKAEPLVQPTPVVAPEPKASAPALPLQESPETQEAEAPAMEFDLAELKKLKVTKLRRLARQIPSFAIARDKIKFARKKELLEAFEHHINTLS